MRPFKSPARDVTLASICILFFALQGCSGELNAASRNGPGSGTGAANDKDLAAAKPGSTRGGVETSPGQSSPSQAPAGGPTGGTSAGSGVTPPTNVAGAFLVEPQLRTCIADSAAPKISSEASPSKQSGQDVVGLCGLEFIAKAAPMPPDPSQALNLAEPSSSGIFKPSRTASGTIVSVLVSADSPEQAIEKVTKKLHPRNVTLVSDTFRQASETLAGFALTHNRWIIFSKLPTSPGSLQALKSWELELEVAPVSFRDLSFADQVTKILFGEVALYEAMLSFLGGNLMLVVKDSNPSSAELDLVRDWPAHECLNLASSDLILKKLAPIAMTMTSFSALF